MLAVVVTQIVNPSEKLFSDLILPANCKRKNQCQSHNCKSQCSGQIDEKNL